MKLRQQLHEAAKSHFEAEFNSAKATVQVYLTNPTGIGEHPQVVEELVKQVEKMTNAEDCLHSLEENFKDDE